MDMVTFIVILIILMGIGFVEVIKQLVTMLSKLFKKVFTKHD